MRGHYESRAIWLAGLLAIGLALVVQGATAQGAPVFWVVFIGTLVIDLVWYEQVYWVGHRQGREAARREAARGGTITAAEPGSVDDTER